MRAAARIAGERMVCSASAIAKAGTDDILIRLSVVNRGPENATIHLLPTFWFRNTWSWGRTGEGYWPEPRISLYGENRLVAEHASLGKFQLSCEPVAEILFTE